jgi:hypothetical protein
MNQFDTVRYITKAASGFLLLSVYDKFIDGKSFMDYSLYNSGSFALSLVVSELSADFISSFWNMNERSIQGMITKPLLTGLVYLYLYDYMVAPRYDREIPKTGTELFVMGSVGQLLV